MTEIFEDAPPPRFCGCHVERRPCQAPATWHFRLRWRGLTRTAYSCDAHRFIAHPLSFDHHRVGEACGKPGCEWVPRTPGESFCHVPEDTAEQLTRLTTTLQPA